MPYLIGYIFHIPVSSPGMSTAKKLKLSLKRRSGPSAIKSGNGCKSDSNQREKTDKGSSHRIIDTSVVASLTPRFCGLTNNGNTCYINVVIQVLRFFPVLMQRLMEISNVCMYTSINTCR